MLIFSIFVLGIPSVAVTYYLITFVLFIMSGLSEILEFKKKKRGYVGYYPYTNVQ
jgi:hypothetical protein